MLYRQRWQTPARFNPYLYFMKNVLLVSFLFLWLPIFGQSVFVLDQEEKLLGRISGDSVYTGPEEVTFVLRGQLIRSLRDNRSWLVDCDDFFGRKAGLVKTNGGKTISCIIRKGSVFLGDHPVDENHEKLLQLVRQDSVHYLVLHGLSGDTLGHVTGAPDDAGMLFAISLLYMETFQLEQDIAEHLRWMEEQRNVPAEARIYPLMDSSPTREWTWDGAQFRFYLGGRLQSVWVYDGRRLRCTEGLAAGMEWTWESGVLRPSFDPDPNKQWTWTGEQLQPYWGSNPDQMWTLNGNILRPTWNADTRLQWVVEGEFPLPALALIVLGYAR